MFWFALNIGQGDTFIGKREKVSMYQTSLTKTAYIMNKFSLKKVKKLKNGQTAEISRQLTPVLHLSIHSTHSKLCFLCAEEKKKSDDHIKSKPRELEYQPDPGHWKHFLPNL